MSGYAYGGKAPEEECGACGGTAHAEFCDVGVGYVQVEPWACGACGAVQGDDGTWTVPPPPSARGERVTGYLVMPEGHVFETTFEEDHKALCARLGTTGSALRASGAVRVTCLEGYALDLPPFMSARARRALSRTLARADADGWGLPYVLEWGAASGREMPRHEVMSVVSGLPSPPDNQGMKP